MAKAPKTNSKKADSLKSISSGLVVRSTKLAGLALGAGKRAAEYRLQKMIQKTDSKIQSKVAGLLLDQAKVLAEQLGQLKGSVMKVGQMLSVYGEHFLSPEINEVLKSLQFESPPLEWEAIKKVLNSELSAEALNELEIEPTPMASASIGQVHRAQVKSTGEELAIKIQYPGVDRAIQNDLKVLGSIFNLAELMPQVPHLDLLLEEVRSMLLQEIDYSFELKYLEEFSALLDGDRRFVVPKAYPQYSSSKVITQSYEPGDPVDSEQVAALSQKRRNQLAEAALELYASELFRWGKVQTDPHLGNYRVRIGQGQDQLVLFDFGAVREFSPEFVSHYRDMLLAALEADDLGIERAAYRLGFLQPEDDENLKNEFVGFCHLMVEPFMQADRDYDWRSSDLPKRLTTKVGQVISAFHLRVPPQEVVFLDRKTSGVFVFLSVLGADFQGRKNLLSIVNHSHPALPADK